MLIIPVRILNCNGYFHPVLNYRHDVTFQRLFLQLCRDIMLEKFDPVTKRNYNYMNDFFQSVLISDFQLFFFSVTEYNEMHTLKIKF